MPTEKTCTKCGATKPTNEFYADPTSRDGYKTHCKVCVRVRSKSWREDHPEEVAARGKLRYEVDISQEGSKCCAACGRIDVEFYRDSTKLGGLDVYCKACKKTKRDARLEKLKTEAPEEAEALKARNLDNNRAWRKNNATRDQAARRAWREKNSEKLAAQHVAWVEANPEKYEELQERKKIKDKAKRAARRTEREADHIANPPTPKPPPTEKVCLGCHLLKPIAAFGKHSEKGHTARCRACLNAARNPDPTIVEAMAQRKALRALGMKMCNGCGVQKPLEEFSPDARSNKRQPRCKECAIAWQKKYRDTPIGAARSKAVGEAWRAAHPDEIKAMGIAYRKANPEKIAAHNTRRMARLNDVEDTLTPDEVKLILKESKASGDLCTYCGKPCGKRVTLDHIFPLAKGGPNTAENLTVACKSAIPRSMPGLSSRWYLRPVSSS